MASVRIEKLCKTFDEKTNVVDDVSVCIRDNEFVVIVGAVWVRKNHNAEYYRWIRETLKRSYIY